MLLQYIHIIFPPHDAIYFVKCTSPSCSKAPPQHDAATPVLHGWDGVLRLASIPLFSSKHNDGHYGQTVLFLFHQTRGHFSKSTIFLSGSMMSLFSSGEFGAVEVKGRVLFSLDYDTQREELQIRVCRCEDLAAARKNHSDPYVKAYLLPDKSSHSKKKTSVKKKTLNPVFDQTLKVRAHTLTLNLSVWHAAPLSRNLFLGEVELELAHWDWKHTRSDWYQLQPRVGSGIHTHTPQHSVSLTLYVVLTGGGLPLTGELHIWLREAQGLLSTKGGAVDSFIKSYVLPDTSRSSGQKTRVVKRSVSPTYNHTMVYDGFQPADLKEACAELTVWHREGLKTHLLGGVRLSRGTGLSYGVAVCWMDSTEEEASVWNSMILNPNHWMDTTLHIRTNLADRPE
uniref:Synaptotagmin-like protein 1 n=1 Tax=Hucho hucho TaxID=62062 RepID=A0A4W5NB86_9TELE